MNGKLTTSIIAMVFFWASIPGQAAANFIFKGQIVDTANEPVSGAEVYVFDSANVRRPADFISNRTGRDGFFRVELPPGHYWTMAIMRSSGASLGPLGKDDKHSGEPYEIDPEGRKEITKDFTVMDLQEAAKANQKRSETLVKISGRILDEKGIAVEMAYVLADPRKKINGIPRYVSTWTGSNGAYLLYLPKGRMFIGAAEVFPPGSDYIDLKEIDLTEDKNGLDLVIADKQQDIHSDDN